MVSTKGKIIADKEYLDLIKSCNCVVQISMVCDKYDVRRIVKSSATLYEKSIQKEISSQGICEDDD